MVEPDAVSDLRVRMKWFLVYLKNGERVETLAPHFRAVHREIGRENIKFMREIKSDDAAPEIEKVRYYNPTSRQGKPQ
jgi:hypothetical protein